MSNKKTFEAIPKLNDHGSSCSGHANYMLDCTYEKQEDRTLIVSCLNNYIEDEE